MKRISDLDAPIPHPDDEATEQQKAATGTLRRYLRVMFLNLPPSGLEQSDRYAQIASKLRVVGDSVDFEEAEFTDIFDKAKNNVMQWPGHLHHYIVTKMRDAESRKLDIKIEEAK